MATKRELNDGETEQDSKKAKLVEEDSDDDSCSDSESNDRHADDSTDTRWELLVDGSVGKTFTMIIEAAEDGCESMIYWIPDHKITDEDRSDILLPLVKAGSPESKSWDSWLRKTDEHECWGKYGFRHCQLVGKATRLPVSVVYTWASWY